MGSAAQTNHRYAKVPDWISVPRLTIYVSASLTVRS